MESLMVLLLGSVAVGAAAYRYISTDDAAPAGANAGANAGAKAVVNTTAPFDGFFKIEAHSRGQNHMQTNHAQRPATLLTPDGQGKRVNFYKSYAVIA